MRIDAKRSRPFATLDNAKRSTTAAGQPDRAGLLILLVGQLMTALVLLYFVLSRSRRRAWGLVEEKAGQLQHSALHDSLTGLPNRGLVLDRAAQMLARARRADAPVTALAVDVDGFDQINDRFGSPAGDEFLRQVAGRLDAVIRDSDTLGRIGGDEFLMLVDCIGMDVGPELVAERILDVLRQPMHVSAAEHSPISATASIGIATGLPGSVEGLLHDANVALHNAKAAGGDRYVVFESAMQTAAQDRIHLEMDLTDAIEADELFLLYQPILELQHERIVAVEALLRWRHPTRGVITPNVFIPIAEKNGLIVAIGRWALDQACAQGAAWRDGGYPLDVSVNVSTRQLERTQFVEEVRAALLESGLDAEALTLEITETSLMRNPQATARLLADLKALGTRIAVDDFGTGYSSLAYLRQFAVDLLKIDGTFVVGLERSSEARALLHTLIVLGKTLGLKTIAEGVEHRGQVRQLQREGCDLAQGFLFARPLAADAIERMLGDATNPPAPPLWSDRVRRGMSPSVSSTGEEANARHV
jgi:diguanylate cyclase (GGDEF)-like protein